MPHPKAQYHTLDQKGEPANHQSGVASIHFGYGTAHAGCGPPAVEKMALRIGYFGLPLAAWLMASDGHCPSWAVLSPIDGPGRRRLQRQVGASRVVAAADHSAKELQDRIDHFVENEPVDLVISWFWTRRLPEAVISRPALGAVGAHPSLLPRHRGPNPFFWAIDCGDAETGATLHRLASTYDTGDIIAQEKLAIGNRNAWQLARALDRLTLRLLRIFVAQQVRGLPISSRPQNAADATWAPEPSGSLLRVQWSWPVDRILRRIRALSSVPGLALTFSGLDFFVTAAEPTQRFPRVLLPGEGVLEHGLEPRLIIRAGDGALAVTQAVVADTTGEQQNISGTRLGILLTERAARET